MVKKWINPDFFKPLKKNSDSFGFLFRAPNIQFRSPPTFNAFLFCVKKNSGSNDFFQVKFSSQNQFLFPYFWIFPKFLSDPLFFPDYYSDSPKKIQTPYFFRPLIAWNNGIRGPKQKSEKGGVGKNRKFRFF